MTNIFFVNRFLITIYICLTINGQVFATGLPKGNEVGKEVARKSLCLGCHGENQKIIGPAFAEIAKRYDNNLQSYTYLSSKIKNGGVGAWGSIPMPANRNNISEEEVSNVIDWIFSMKQVVK